MLICVFRIWKDLSHPRVNKLWGMGREGFSPFSYISQAASSNARLSRESEGLVLTDAHLNWGGGETRSRSKKSSSCLMHAKKTGWKSGTIHSCWNDLQ